MSLGTRTSEREGIPRFGLVAEYKMIDASGTTLPDSSGNAYDGTLVGSPTLSATTGVTLNGTTQYATLPSGVIVSNLPSYSVIMAVSGASQVTRYWWSEGNSGSANTQSGLASSGAGTIQRLLCRDSANTIEIQNACSLTVLDSTAHVIGVADRYLNGTTSAPWFYADGRPDTNLGVTGYTRSVKTLDRATFGALGKSTYAAQFAGALYYAVIYNRALTSEEMRAAQLAIRRVLKGRGLL